MKKILTLLLMTVFIAACSTTTKKYKELPALAADAPVQMFWEKPNLKYEEICSITIDSNNSFFPGHTAKEDFQSQFESEARKCGADGVIFGFINGYTKGSVTAYATGVKVLSKEATALDIDKIRAFSLAVQAHDLTKVQSLLSGIAKVPEERAPSDDELVNAGLYIAALEGLRCDEKMVDFLVNDYQARIRKYGVVSLNASGKSDANIPYCQNVMAKSIVKVAEKDLTDTLLKTHNYYIELLNRDTHAKDFNRMVSAYHDLLVASAELIQKACARSQTDSSCILKKTFVDESAELKKSKNHAIKRNAQDLLKALAAST